MRWIGHSGLAAGRPGGAPDRRCLDRALRLSLAMLEVDVCVTADAALALHHDAHLTDGTPMHAVGLAAARQAIPDLLTLDEAAEQLAGRLPLLLDLKGSEVVAPLAAWLHRRSDPDQFAVCGDIPGALAHLRDHAPAVARWRSLPEIAAGSGEGRRRILAAVLRHRLAARLPELVAEVGAAGVCIDHWALSRALCAQAARLGMEVDAWTINRPVLARVAERAGADLITTDRPERMRAALGSASAAPV